MTIREKMILLAALFLPSLLFAGGGGEAQAQGENGYWTITGAQVEFQWKIESSNLDVVLTAPTTGWISVGFDPSQKMKDANIIIGYVKDGQVFLRDDFGVEPKKHQSDESLGGRSDISDAGGSENDGTTQIRFTIPLDSGDSKDRALSAGGDYRVILAYGTDEADGFGSYHAKRTTVKIKL